MKNIFDIEKNGRINAPNVAVAKAGSKSKIGFVINTIIVIEPIIQKEIKFNIKKR